ncbi:MAG: energy transducer TonB [Bacteroidota bacterium]
MTKQVLFAAPLWLLSLIAHAQTASLGRSLDFDAERDTVFAMVEVNPEFPGGYDSLMANIRRKMTYPVQARRDGVQGTVYVSFVVTKSGDVTDVKVIRGISPECDEVARQVVAGLPRWKPGQTRNRLVHTRFVLPLKFSLTTTKGRSGNSKQSNN